MLYCFAGLSRRNFRKLRPSTDPDVRLSRIRLLIWLIVCLISVYPTLFSLKSISSSCQSLCILTLTINPHIAFPSVRRVGTPIYGISAQGSYPCNLKPYCLRLAHYITVTHSRLASNAVVSSLFDRISTCRIARP